MPRELHSRWEWRLRSSPDELWPLVTNTNRFDYDAGMPAVEQSWERAQTGGERIRAVRSMLGGMPVEWEEKPFEWVRPRVFGVERLFRKGPLRKLRVLVELTPIPTGGTVVIYQSWLSPSSVFFSLVLSLQLRFSMPGKFAAIFRRYDELAGSGLPIVTFPHSVALAPGARKRIEAARAALQEAGGDIADKLIHLIETADDMTLSRLRPYALADGWHSPRNNALELLLKATRAGLLNLQWDLLCPFCRGAPRSAETLATVGKQVHCDGCNIDFEVNFERSVELTFKPNPAVREVVTREYCTGGPGVTPHIVAQQVLAPRSARDLTLPLEPGRYRMRAGDFPGGRYFTAVEGGGAADSFHVSAEGWPLDEPLVSLKPALRVINETDSEQVIIIERTAWGDQAVTAAEVTALQVFRDLFSAEALRPGEQISVGSLAVLFTDLRDSTALYREIGDAPAFGRVMAHFDVLHDAVAEHGGAVVKTIGDAVMAVFRRPVGALNAILQAQREFSHETQDGRPLRLKAGIHFGRCIAVTLNERLDYFGSTVNFAARIQRLSSGGDVILSGAVFDDHEVAEMLALRSREVNTESFGAVIRGFDNENFLLTRVALRERHNP